MLSHFTLAQSFMVCSLKEVHTTEKGTAFLRRLDSMEIFDEWNVLVKKDITDTEK